jgi:hypothetical protein
MFPFSNDQTSAASLPEGTCPVCEAYPITTPFMAIPCGHLYCYFCLRTRTLADANFQCRRCSTNVVALKRFQEQVGAATAQWPQRSAYLLHLLRLGPKAFLSWFEYCIGC